MNEIIPQRDRAGTLKNTVKVFISRAVHATYRSAFQALLYKRRSAKITALLRT
jgi:hypothetical protein